METCPQKFFKLNSFVIWNWIRETRNRIAVLLEEALKDKQYGQPSMHHLEDLQWKRPTGPLACVPWDWTSTKTVNNHPMGKMLPFALYKEIIQEMVHHCQIWKHLFCFSESVFSTHSSRWEPRTDIAYMVHYDPPLCMESTTEYWLSVYSVKEHDCVASSVLPAGCSTSSFVLLRHNVHR